MKLIIPSFEIWEQDSSSPVEGMYAHIARCTRVCYQSEKKNDAETEEDFVNRVILRHEPWNSEANHLAMLEHGTVYLTCSINSDNYKHILNTFKNNKYSNVRITATNLCVTTNFRVIVENDLLYYMKYVTAPTENHARRVTVSFITNIGVSREFNRHRVDSIAEESTRYCNYSLGKFGNHITCIKPSWLLDSMSADREQYEQLALDNIIKQYGTEDEHNWEDIDYYLFSLMVSNYCYNNLILKGWKPQQAREVLPLATKTQLIHTAFVDDWKHFFALRADGVSGPPHPNAKLVAAPLKEEMIEYNLI